MELRTWAFEILSGSNLSSKLLDPGPVTDFDPGPAYFFDEPSRAPHLKLSKRSQNQKLPPFHEHGSEAARIKCLHRFCGHELLAVELLAFAALAFPNAPSSYRRSLIHHIKEEQSHVRLYQNRLIELGSDLGQEPLYRHFWAVTAHLHSLESFISYMNLTIEQANLDFAPMYLSSFSRHGDELSAKVMSKILEDEIGHVKLGVCWLSKAFNTKDQVLFFEKWKMSLPALTDSSRAMGFLCHSAPRVAAGLSKEWIERLCPSKSMHIDLSLSELLGSYSSRQRVDHLA